ncbi:hypothetical protein WDU94_012792, partial [Cyamophila willieti]
KRISSSSRREDLATTTLPLPPSRKSSCSGGEEGKSSGRSNSRNKTRKPDDEGSSDTGGPGCASPGDDDSESEKDSGSESETETESSSSLNRSMRSRRILSDEDKKPSLSSPSPGSKTRSSRKCKTEDEEDEQEKSQEEQEKKTPLSQEAESRKSLRLSARKKQEAEHDKRLGPESDSESESEAVTDEGMKAKVLEIIEPLDDVYEFKEPEPFNFKQKKTISPPSGQTVGKGGKKNIGLFEDYDNMEEDSEDPISAAIQRVMDTCGETQGEDMDLLDSNSGDSDISNDSSNMCEIMKKRLQSEINTYEGPKSKLKASVKGGDSPTTSMRTRRSSESKSSSKTSGDDKPKTQQRHKMEKTSSESSEKSDETLKAESEASGTPGKVKKTDVESSSKSKKSELETSAVTRTKKSEMDSSKTKKPDDTPTKVKKLEIEKETCETSTMKARKSEPSESSMKTRLKTEGSSSPGSKTRSKTEQLREEAEDTDEVKRPGSPLVKVKTVLSESKGKPVLPVKKTGETASVESLKTSLANKMVPDSVKTVESKALTTAPSLKVLASPMSKTAQSENESTPIPLSRMMATLGDKSKKQDLSTKVRPKVLPMASPGMMDVMKNSKTSTDFSVQTEPHDLGEKEKPSTSSLYPKLQKIESEPSTIVETKSTDIPVLQRIETVLPKTPIKREIIDPSKIDLIKISPNMPQLEKIDTLDTATVEKKDPTGIAVTPGKAESVESREELKFPPFKFDDVTETPEKVFTPAMDTETSSPLKLDKIEFKMKPKAPSPPGFGKPSARKLIRQRIEEVKGTGIVGKDRKSPQPQLQPIVKKYGPSNMASANESTPSVIESTVQNQDTKDTTPSIASLSGKQTMEGSPNTLINKNKDSISTSSNKPNECPTASVLSKSKETPSNISNKTKDSPTTLSSKAKDSPTTLSNKAKDSPTTLLSKSKDSPTTLLSKPKDSPTTLSSKAKDSPTTLSSKAKDSPTTLLSKPKDSPTTLSSKAKDSPTTLLSKPKDSPTTLSSKAKDSPTTLLSKPKDIPNNSPGVVDIKTKDVPSPMLSKSKDSTSNVSSKIKDVTTPVSSKMRENPFSTVSNKSKDIATPGTSKNKESPTPVSSKIKDTPTFVSSKIKTISTPVSAKIKDIATPVSTKIKDISTPVSSKIKDSATPVSSKIKDSVTPVSSKIRESPLSASKQVKDIPTPVSNKGKDPSTPLSQKIRDVTSPVSIKIKDTSTPILSKTKDNSIESSTLRESSPTLAGSKMKDISPIVLKSEEIFPSLVANKNKDVSPNKSKESTMMLLNIRKDISLPISPGKHKDTPPNVADKPKDTLSTVPSKKPDTLFTPKSNDNKEVLISKSESPALATKDINKTAPATTTESETNKQTRTEKESEEKSAEKASTESSMTKVPEKDDLKKPKEPDSTSSVTLLEASTKPNISPPQKGTKRNLDEMMSLKPAGKEWFPSRKPGDTTRDENAKKVTSEKIDEKHEEKVNPPEDEEEKDLDKDDRSKELSSVFEFDEALEDEMSVDIESESYLAKRKLASLGDSPIGATDPQQQVSKIQKMNELEKLKQKLFMDCSGESEELEEKVEEKPAKIDEKQKEEKKEEGAEKEEDGEMKAGQTEDSMKSLESDETLVSLCKTLYEMRIL